MPSAHPHELAGQQDALRVREQGADLNRAGLRVDPFGDYVNPARLGIDGATALAQLDREVALGDRCDAPLVQRPECLPRLVREGEADIGEVELGDGGAYCLLRQDQRANRGDCSAVTPFTGAVIAV